MKQKFFKQAVLICQFALLAFAASAQYTETFESQVPDANTFSSNGQSFSLTNSFLIFSSRAGYGFNHSNRFVDNGSNVALNQTDGIATTDGKQFSVKNLWLYVSADGGNNPSADGSLIITGKLAGVTQFIINKTTGFRTSFVPNNGYSYVDFTSEGGVDNSNIHIDEIDFQVQGNFNYVAIDNFTWGPTIILPLSLLSFNAAILSDGNVKLSWQTAFENNTSHFLIEKSNDGIHFYQLGKITAAANTSITSTYGFIDNVPASGTNYYRLNEVDLDGKTKDLGIKSITLANRFYESKIYPNPAIGGIFTLSTSLTRNVVTKYFISDISGRIVKTGVVSSGQQQMDISQLSSGNYSLKLSSGEVIKLIKD